MTIWYEKCPNLGNVLRDKVGSGPLFIAGTGCEAKQVTLQFSIIVFKF